MLMDSDMSYSKHIHCKINTAFKMLGIIKPNFKNLSVVVFILLYKCMVRSYLEYAAAVWNPHEKSLIK